MDHLVSFENDVIGFPPRNRGRISNFDLSAADVLRAAGYDKLYDPDQAVPDKPDAINDYAPVYRLDGGRIVFDRWRRRERSLSPLDKIMLHEMQIHPDTTGIRFTAEDIGSVASCFADWLSGTSYKRGNIVQFEGKLYRAEHDINAPYNEMSPTAEGNHLWIEISDTREEWPAWLQGGGSGQNGTYMTGDKVTHNGSHWESIIDYNGHEPSASAWAAWKEVD